jgi:hypothetical protein
MAIENALNRIRGGSGESRPTGGLGVVDSQSLSELGPKLSF